LNIAVVGDHIIDEYLQGRAVRISPEAPVQIIDVEDSKLRLGGASNVVKILATLGANPYFYSVVGNDDDAIVSRTLLDGQMSGGILLESLRQTTRKTRVLSSGQQLMRLDRENSMPIKIDEEKLILQAIEKDYSLSGLSAIVLSDYGKGVVSKGLCKGIIDWARGRNIPVIVDPKGRDWSKYSGATVVKPNLLELTAMADVKLVTDDEIADVASALCREFDISSMLITLGAKGMIYVGSGGAEHSLPTFARDVFDVTGAGDSVTAILALGVALGADMAEIMHLANAAAGIVVSRVGTCAPSSSEIMAWITGINGQSKIFSLADALVEVKRLRSAGKKILFTNGCFDLFHAGHILFLTQTRKMGDYLVLAVNDDESVTRLKGKGRPLLDLETRMRILSALECVDMVLPFHGDSPIEIIEAIQPDIMVKGSNYEKHEVEGADLVSQSGGKVEIIQSVADIRNESIKCFLESISSAVK
jgi:D-beta-D-heptose 7-phosphate kinase/D-beta-D-heptose 1-phosphate adenosyltransferase